MMMSSCHQQMMVINQHQDAAVPFSTRTQNSKVNQDLFLL
jgi:hypothetical protein